VVNRKPTEVSKEHVATIFRVEEYAKQKIGFKQKASRVLLLVYYLAYSSTLKMEATCSFETLIDFQRTTRHYIADDRIGLLCIMPKFQGIGSLRSHQAFSYSGSSQHFVEPICSLPCSQETTTDLYFSVRRIQSSPPQSISPRPILLLHSTYF
jgi:hypothetical protein